MSRALQEIESDCMRLVQIRLLGAIEARNWVVVNRIADELKELANRGLYHTSQSRLKDVGKYAMNGHTEPPENR